MTERASRTGAWLAGAAALVVAACARQSPPPGGPQDLRPPVVISTTPAAFDTVEELSTTIRFDFDERISERSSAGTLDDAVAISPRTGDVRVSHGRRSLTVRIEGGLRPGIVYRVTLAPAISDMFGNQLTRPFELVFSTGPEPVATTLAGQAWDRITGVGASQVTVQAIGADSLVHASTANREGIFAFRYLPGGDFDLFAFEDRNRDGVLDAGETQGAVLTAVAIGDTVLVDVPILAPDTMPAILLDAEAPDSVTLLLTFDDFLEPTVDVAGLDIALEREEGAVPVVSAVLHEADYLAFRQTVVDSFARLDSIAAEVAAAEARARAAEQAALDSAAAADSTVQAPDPAPADSVAAAADSTPVAVPDTLNPLDPDAGPSQEAAPARPTPVALPPSAGSPPGPMAGTDRVLPSRRLVVRLESPIERDVGYSVTAFGVVNINGLGGGGGDAIFTLETPADTAVADSSAIGDSIGPDTGSVQPDTGRVVGMPPEWLFPRR